MCTKSHVYGELDLSHVTLNFTFYVAHYSETTPSLCVLLLSPARLQISR